LGMIFALFGKSSYFKELWKKSSELDLKRKSTGTLAMILFFFLTQNVDAQDSLDFKINKKHAEHFGTIFVQDNAGRKKPLNTLNSELIRKISHQSTFHGLNHNQVILGMLFNQEYWQNQPMIEISHPELMKILGTNQNKVSYNQFFSKESGQYKLKDLLFDAMEKKPEKRDKLAKEIIAVNERVNLAYQIFNTYLLKIFPKPGEPEQSWLSPAEAWNNDIKNPEDKRYAAQAFLNYYYAFVESQKSGKWEIPDMMVDSLINFQKKHAKATLPSDFKANLEINYINIDIFNKLFKYYGLMGILFLIILFIGLLKPKLKLKRACLVMSLILGLIFILHTIGLATRWYISGHAPLSNGYESLVFISWAIMLAGFIFMKRSNIVLAATAILASITLMVAHLSWMDPQITNLAPVLKSYWLSIHVSVIIIGYGFLALGALLGLLNLALMIMKNPNNKEYLNFTIEQLTTINKMTLIIGTYLLTIGTFLGAVWANESWGRYWGWDPKETWALISIITYTIVLHSRFIPRLNNQFAFNLLALIGFSSILMTYFGVNYYLSGMHSYAQGNPMQVSIWVYISPVLVFVLAIISFLRNARAERTPVNIT
jgi:cytochrome c-type biogenesis protein CcsB